MGDPNYPYTRGISPCLLAVWCTLSLMLSGCSGSTLEVCNTRLDFGTYSTPTTGNALSGTLYFDLNNPFNCYGIIKEWRFCYRRSPGIISDTLKIGVYQLEGSSYVKKGSNSIFLQLQDSECLTVNANPELVVQQGYVVAFIATSLYIKFYDDSQNGHMWKTVAFPNTVSSGVLIKTTNPYAPKLQGFVQNLETTTTSAIPSTTMTNATATSSTILPSTNAILSSSIGNSSIPFATSQISLITTNTGTPPSSGNASTSAFLSTVTLPDIIISTPAPPPLLSSAAYPATPTTSPVANRNILPTPELQLNECSLGIKQAKVITSYQTTSSAAINIQQPSTCNGYVKTWEICYQEIDNDYSDVYLGIWRPMQGIEDDFQVVGIDTIVIHRDDSSNGEGDPMVHCTTVSGDLQGVAEGDYIGVISPDVSIAFAVDEALQLNHIKRDITDPVPMIRAVIEESLIVSSTGLTTPTTSPSDTATPPPSPASSNSIAYIISGSVVGLLIVVFLIVALLCLVMVSRQKYYSNRHMARLLRGDREDMDYNLNYAASNPEEDRKTRRSVTFKENPSYSVSTLGDPPIVSSTEHAYESITNTIN